MFWEDSFFIRVLTPYYNHNVRKSWENRRIEVKVKLLRWKEFKDSLGVFLSTIKITHGKKPHLLKD